MLNFKINTLKNIGFLSLGLLLLLVWRLLYQAECYTLLIPLFIGTIITLSIRESYVKKKECIANCYFKEKSFFDTLIRGRFFINIISFIMALILTLSLILYLTLASVDLLLFLFVDMFLLYILYIWLINSTKNSLNHHIRYAIIKDWVVTINSFLSLLVLIYIQLNAYIPSYLEASLTQTITNASSTIASSCETINYLVKANIEKEAIGWWFMLNIDSNLENDNYRLLSWVLFLINGGLSMFAYSRFMVQILDFSYQRNKETNKETNYAN